MKRHLLLTLLNNSIAFQFEKLETHNIAKSLSIFTNTVQSVGENISTVEVFMRHYLSVAVHSQTNA